jgi:hypothetical protein
MTTPSIFGFRPLAISLAFFIAFPVLEAQAPPAQGLPLPTQLNIVVVEGEGAINNARQRVTRDPVVRIEDENHKPIAGAAVVFILPTEGATGEFANGTKSMIVMTDSSGVATAKGVKLNGLPGKVPIHVSVSYRGLTASTTVTEIAELPPGAKAPSAHTGGHGTLIAVIAILGVAAVGGGAYFATHKSGSSTAAVTPPPVVIPIGITPGTGTIVGGR